MPRTQWLDVRRLEHYGVVVEGLRYWWGWHPWHWCRMGCGDCRVIFAGRVEPLRPYVAPEQHPQRPKFRGQPRAYPPRRSRRVPLPGRGGAGHREVRDPCGNDGRDWRPFPDLWADQRVTSGELLLAWLAQRDEKHRPTVDDYNLTPDQRVDILGRYTDARLYDRGRDRKGRNKPRWRERQHPATAQGPSIRRRWPTPPAGPWPRLAPRYGPFPEEHQQVHRGAGAYRRGPLIEHSSDDRGWALVPGPGVEPDHSPEPLPPLPEPWDLKGWYAFADSGHNPRADDEDTLMLPLRRTGSRMGRYFDDIDSDRQARYRSRHEVLSDDDEVTLLDLRQAARDGLIPEWSEAARQRAAVARQHADDDENEAWSTFRGMREP